MSHFISQRPCLLIPSLGGLGFNIEILEGYVQSQHTYSSVFFLFMILPTWYYLLAQSTSQFLFLSMLQLLKLLAWIIILIKMVFKIWALIFIFTDVTKAEQADLKTVLTLVGASEHYFSIWLLSLRGWERLQVALFCLPVGVSNHKRSAQITHQQMLYGLEEDIHNNTVHVFLETKHPAMKSTAPT